MKYSLTNLLYLIILLSGLPFLSHSQSVIQGKINREAGSSFTVYLSNLEDFKYSSMAFDSCSIHPDGNFKCNIAMDKDTFRIIRFRVSSSGPNSSNQDGFHDNTILLPIQRNSTLSLIADADSLFYSVSFPNNTDIDSLFSNLRAIKKDMKVWSRSALEALKKTKENKKASLINNFSDTVKIFSNNHKADYARLIDEESNMYNIVYGLQEYFIATGNSYQDVFLKKTMEKLDSHLPVIENCKKKNTRNTYINTHINNIMDSAVFSPLGSQKNWKKSLKNKDAVIIFWASWCGPCREAIRSKIKDSYPPARKKNIEFISISVDQDSWKAKAAYKSDMVKWPQFLDANGVFNRLELHFIPHYLAFSHKNKTFTIFRDFTEAYNSLDVYHQ